MRTFASAVVVLATMVAAASSANAGGSSIAGTWTGEMRQIDVDQEHTYPMTLTLQGTKGTATYPTLNCSGTWVRVGEKAGYTVYKETVQNEPVAGCIDGIMIVTPDAGKIVIGWFGLFDGQPSLASAVLQKEAQ